MNTETGQVKLWDQLTEEEKKSGKWIELPTGFAKLNLERFGAPKSKSDQKCEEYMRKVEQKKKEGQNV